MQDAEPAEGWPEDPAAEGSSYKPDNLGLIPVTHMVEGGNQVVLRPGHCDICNPCQMRTKNVKQNKNKHKNKATNRTVP